VTKKSLSEFRKAVYQSLRRRADVLFDLIDALTVAGQVSSPVALSEQKPFRRKFCSVYDGLENGEMNMDELLSLLPDCMPADSETIAGYKVYAVDATTNEHEQAETLPDRSVLKSSKHEPMRYGHKYSWVVRLVNFGTSWAAPVDIERINTEAKDTQVAAVQVQELDVRDPKAKVIVADSRYEEQRFVSIFEHLKHTFGLLRLHSNRVLYEAPQEKPKGSRGAPRKHGPPFKLNSDHRVEDQNQTFQLGKQTVRVRAWHNLHFKKLATVIGTLVQVEFLKEDGMPRYKRPMWLFWTGSQRVALSDLCRMYLWRFAIEHMFRFLKQHMGLNSNRSPDLVSAQQWMWLCALASWQLLLMRDAVQEDYPAWYPRSRQQRARLTPYQVQRSALAFLLELGSPASTPRPAGKGIGRQKNYFPPPRVRYPVVFKSKKARVSAYAGS
jgi:DDE superfamily endonuclease